MNITHLQEKIEERYEHIKELEKTNTLNKEALEDCVNYHRSIIKKNEEKIREYLLKGEL